MSQPNKYSGKFITIEGLDGAGKTTQAKLLVQWLGKNFPNQKAIYTREPTDGIIGSQIRLVLNHTLELSDRPLGALFAADRSDHLDKLIVPALDQGKIVICDRYHLSSLAFQSLFLPREHIQYLNSGFLRPDLTVFLDISASIAIQRLKGERGTIERYETPDILERVASAYVSFLSELDQRGEHIVKVDGARSIDEIHSDLTQVVQSRVLQGGPL